jgi:hemerythrin-like metal-binding protein
MSLGWNAAMETGAPVLDAAHRALVERAVGLVASIESGQDRPAVERHLRDFGSYVVRHFSMDEDCHLRGVCPALGWNGQARAELIKILAGFRESYEKQGSSRAVADDLSCQLTDWVGRYIPGPADLVRPCVTTARQPI